MVGTRVLRAVLLPAALLMGAAALTGCTSNPVGAVAAPRTQSPSAAASEAPLPGPSTPPPTQHADDATPVSVKCGKLLPKAVAQSLVPDLTRVKDWQPEAGSVAAQLASIGGTACSFTDSAGDLLEVAVAKPSAEDAVALKNDLVRRSNSVPTYGGEAYFEIVDHVGRVDAFHGRTWISARSNRFFEPGDAIDVVAAAEAALGFAPAASPTPTIAATDAATPLPTPSPAS